MRDYLNMLLNEMKPKYNELTTYLSALTCVVLYIIHPEFRSLYSNILSGYAGPSFIILGYIALAGLIFSVIHVFIERKKSFLEITCMSAFVLGANGLAGIMAGIEMLPVRWSVWSLLPVWNILTGVMMVYQIGLVKNAITNENVSRLEVGIASIAFLITFAIADFGLHLSWAMTFSFCMFCSSAFGFAIPWLINYSRWKR